MSISKPLRYALLLAGVGTYFGESEIRLAPQDLRIWLLEMHAKQIELLKIDWGQPGLCTEQFSKSKKITCKNSRVKLENYSKK